MGDFISNPNNAPYLHETTTTAFNVDLFEYTMVARIKFVSGSTNNTGFFVMQQNVDGDRASFVATITGVRFSYFQGTSNIFSRDFNLASGFNVVAMVRTGNTFRFYVNGVQDGADFVGAGLNATRIRQNRLGSASTGTPNSRWELTEAITYFDPLNLAQISAVTNFLNS